MHGQSTRYSPSSEWAIARELGQLSSDVEHLQDGLDELREDRKKDKAELDKIKTWGERIALLVVLYAMTAGMHASAPLVGPVIGQVARGVIAGLRGP